MMPEGGQGGRSDEELSESLIWVTAPMRRLSALQRW